MLEAIRVAKVYGIRCLVLDDVDAAAPDRLFPDARSLWGKAWEITIDRVEVSVGALGALPPDLFLASPASSLFLEDGSELGSAAQLAHALVRSQPVIDKMNSDAQPEHSFFELVWKQPNDLGRSVCVQKLDPLVLRPIEQFRIVAKCLVTVDEFPLRHGALDGLRVAWGTGKILGAPAMVVATAAEASRQGSRSEP